MWLQIAESAGAIQKGRPGSGAWAECRALPGKPCALDDRQRRSLRSLQGPGYQHRPRRRSAPQPAPAQTIQRYPTSFGSLASFLPGLALVVASVSGAAAASAVLARASKSTAIARNLCFEASRSVVSAMPRKRAASSRRNLGVISSPFGFGGRPSWQPKAPAGSRKSVGGPTECVAGERQTQALSPSGALASSIEALVSSMDAALARPRPGRPAQTGGSGWSIATLTENGGHHVSLRVGHRPSTADPRWMKQRRPPEERRLPVPLREGVGGRGRCVAPRPLPPTPSLKGRGRPCFLLERSDEAIPRLTSRGTPVRRGIASPGQARGPLRSSQ